MRFTSKILSFSLLASTSFAYAPNPQTDAQREMETYGQSHTTTADSQRLSELIQNGHVLSVPQVTALVENGAVPTDVLAVAVDAANKITNTDPTLGEVRRSIAQSGRLQVADIGMAAALVPAFWAGAGAALVGSCYMVLNMDKTPASQNCKPASK